MGDVDLCVDWCSYAAAKYAVEHWHYSQRMPVGKMAKLGVWEQGKFAGVVVFTRGPMNVGSPYSLQQNQVCELARVALNGHESPVTQVLAYCRRHLKIKSPLLRLIVSFADLEQGHHGGIYQGDNWIYTGLTGKDKMYWFEGRWQHSREIRGGAFGGTRKLNDYSHLPTRPASRKHRYLYPLDKAMRRQIEPLAQPYPKRADEVHDGA